MTYLEFEKPLADLEGKAEELRALARKGEGVDLEKEAAALDRKAEDARAQFSSEDRNRALFERDDDRDPGPHMLNRSFSGTY